MTSVCWRILRVKGIFAFHQQKKTKTVKVNYAAAVMAYCYFPGVEPQTLDEWKLLIQLSQLHGSDGELEQESTVNGSSCSNGSDDSTRKINPESLTLMLARRAGLDPAIAVLEECGVQPDLSPPSKLVFELLRVTEKRQRWVSGMKRQLILKNHNFCILTIFALFQSNNPDDARALRSLPLVPARLTKEGSYSTLLVDA